MGPPESEIRRAPSADLQLRMLELMMLMKATDDRVVKGIRTGEFISYYYSHRGQEAIAAPLGVTLRQTDHLVTTYRGMHDHIGKGIPLVHLLAEVIGKSISPSQGKGGMMHVAWPPSGVMLSTGIVGAGIPVAVGLATAAQLEGADRVTAVSFGDGATNTGSFHEAANLAAVWASPVVFVCQNNLYGEKTPVEKTMNVERIADRASAYGMAGTRVNGNDPDEVYDALYRAVERARTGGGPSLVECMTFRFRGHSMGDDMKYIPQEQMAWAEANDPVPTYGQRLLSSGVSTEGGLKRMEETASQAVEEALEIVLAASSPSLDELSEHLYADPDKTPV